MLKILQKFFFLLVGLNSILHSQSQNISQKLADDPIDRPIQVRHIGAQQSDILCYAPVFTKGEGYIYLDYCTSKSVKNARYDVFGRISYNIEGNWLCLSAPSSVTGINGTSTQEWDYLLLRPCVINDKNQKWRIENDSIYTADKKFKVKDYKSYAFISKNPNDYYDHKLTGVMNDWKKRIARPGNISTKTPLGWLFKTQDSWTLYYLQNNQSTADEVVDLYYNPENGHLAQYYKESGEMFCLTSNLQKGQEWNWASWESCIDQIDKNADKSRYWELFALNDNEGMLKDYWGNFLRVTSYGPNWGVPYTIKEDYFKQDTANSPISDFIFSYDINLWNRYTFANLQDSLEYCPAPGGKGFIKTKTKRDLPPNFNLTEEWISRLYAIAQSTALQYASEKIAFCGICMLHSYQMVAELINYSVPISSGGYFFDTAPNSNPFTSFRQRFPTLAQRLEQSEAFVNRNFSGNDNLATRMGRLVYGMSIGMIPQHIITPSAMLEGREQINQLLQNIIDSPIGSVFIVVFYRTNQSGSGLAGHAQPILRTQEGVRVIPTNNISSLEDFRNLLQPLQTTRQIRRALTLQGQRRLVLLQTLRIQRPFNNPLSVTLSQNNCTGEGEHRRGSGTLPSSATINQCSSGRCLE